MSRRDLHNLSVPFLHNGRGMTRNERKALDEKKDVRNVSLDGVTVASFEVESLFGMDVIALPDGDLGDYVTGVSCLVDLAKTISFICANAEVHESYVEQLLHAQNVLLQTAHLGIQQIEAHKDLPKDRPMRDIDAEIEYAKAS